MVLRYIRKPTGLGIALTASAMLASGALADDPWTGSYAGATGGYGWGTGSHSSTVIPVPPPEEEESEIDDGKYRLRGGMLGAALGYNYMVGQTLLGIEGDYSGAWVDGDADCSGNHCGGKLSSFGTVRARLGYDFGGLLAYATAGAAFGKFKAFTDNPPGYSGTDMRVGWTAGAGLERKLSSRSSLKLEYLYADFGTNDQFTILGNTPERIDVSVNVIRVGFNLKLGN